MQYLLPALLALVMCLVFYFQLGTVGCDGNTSKNNNNTNTNNNTKNRATLKTGLEYGKRKSNCSVDKVYCFTDAQCLNSCMEKMNHLYDCINGICEISINRLKETAIVQGEPCNTEKGMFTFIMGDPAMGSYMRSCKSVDLGIAISNTENLMCKGDPSAVINYHSAYPIMDDCTDCKQPIVIPATYNKRRHKECNNPFYRMVEHETKLYEEQGLA
ncbi:per-os infectivity factor 3 [Helicoverpa zea nudivirus 2]|uniref:Per-os infectivity factor 3 n=1 Tax=Helicoverpa zea nudivirus 2 TaxID=1128424 RepID=G9I079_HZNV2|nr:orf53 gene product [Helicoverpa zea nudivirus 2]AEW69602.1 per-os infectivity factor 3 [Helicoverpa zea nudivirus 2]